MSRRAGTSHRNRRPGPQHEGQHRLVEKTPVDDEAYRPAAGGADHEGIGVADPPAFLVGAVSHQDVGEEFGGVAERLAEQVGAGSGEEADGLQEAGLPAVLREIYPATPEILAALLHPIAPDLTGNPGETDVAVARLERLLAGQDPTGVSRLEGYSGGGALEVRREPPTDHKGGMAGGGSSPA